MDLINAINVIDNIMDILKDNMNKISILLFIVTIFLGCEKDNPTQTEKDTTPPNVSITSPINNASVLDSTLIVVDVSDNVAVEKVEFYIDGNLASTRSAVPWQYKWTVRDLPSNSIHAILAKAYDAVGNIGTSAIINVSTNKTVQALLLNGSTDYVRIPSSSSLTSFGNQITIEAWIKINNLGLQGGTILASGNENAYDFAFRSDGKLGVTMVNVNPQINAEFIGKSTLTINNWYHVAFTYDGSIETILINGLIDTSFSITGNIGRSLHTEIISIGAYCYDQSIPYSSFMNGLIDEVRIWNTSRSQSEIQATMNNELSGSESGLMGYWRFNGEVIDASPNNNNGTINGNPSFISVVR